MSGLALADRERWRDRGQLKRGAESPRSDGATTGKTLSDLGISKDQSSRWQKLAQVPADEFEATFAGESKPSTGGIIGKHAKKNAVNDDALWLWGRLLDFERNGLLDQDLNEICAGMLDHMKEAVRELAPRVAKWLPTPDPSRRSGSVETDAGMN